jgi:LuxR family transcriptional regulator, maltose regulon positive regulatory protein
VLSAGYAHALLATAGLEGVEGRLRDAERWLETGIDRPDGSEMVVVDEEAFRLLPGQIAVARAGLALALGDLPATVTFARRVPDLVPEDDHLRRGSAAALLGLASWTSGDLETGRRAYAEAMTSLQRAGHISDVLGCAIAVADMLIAQGRLHEAMRAYEQALQLATGQTAPGAPILRGTADMYVGLSALDREHNDLSAATERLLKSKELGEHNGLPQNAYRRRVAMARIREAEGDLDGALDLLEEAEGLYVGDFSPDVRPVAASKTRVWVAQGKLGDALDWARARGLSTQDDLHYLREFEHITLARLLLARYKSEGVERFISDAMGLLERLLLAAEEGARAGSLIEILILQALAHQARSHIPAALLPLERALALAEPEGYVRIFVDEGAPMAQLLQEAAAGGMMPAYAGQLLAGFAGARQAPAGASPRAVSPAAAPTSEPLSQREMDVLRLFATELSGPEIAQELVIALSTVRTHTKSIYSKLNVTSRRAAVKRAAALGLL